MCPYKEVHNMCPYKEYIICAHTRASVHLILHALPCMGTYLVLMPHVDLDTGSLAKCSVRSISMNGIRGNVLLPT